MYVRRLARPFALAVVLVLVTATAASAATPRPTALTATPASSTAITLQWADKSTNERSFEIQRSPANTSTFKQIATPAPNATTYTDTGLTPATGYKYRVRALKPTTGASSWSNVATATTLGGTTPDTTKPSAPAEVGAGAASCSQINVAWSQATDNPGGSGIGKYNLYRNNVLVQSTIAPSNTAADTGLNASTTYSYAVTAVDRAGNESVKSTNVNATTPSCGTVVPVPTGFKADSTSCGFATATWNPIFDPNNTYDIKKFNLYRNNVLTATVNTPATTAVAANLSPLTSYSFAVTAVDSSNRESAKAVPFSLTTPACPPAGAWAKTVGGAGSEVASSVAVDSAGNVIVGGMFAGTADFGGGPVTASPAGEIFVAKYSATRTLLWVNHYAATATYRPELNAVAVDAAGNVFVGGGFFGTLSLGGGALVNGQAGYRDAFLAKYSTTGAHQWSRRYGGPVDDSVNGIAIDSNQNPVVTGSFKGDSVDFGGRTLSHTGGAFGGDETFVVKLSSANATNLFARVTGCSGSDHGRGIAVDAADNVIVTGLVGSSCTFGGGVLLPQNNIDAYVVKYAASGAFAWAKTFGAQWQDRGNAVAVDGSGNVIVAGTFAGVADFGTGPLGRSGLSPWGFVAKFTGSGTPVWSKAFGSDFSTHGHSVAADGAGNVTVTGMFEGTVDFGGGPLTAPQGQGIALPNAYVVQYSATGAHVASNRYGQSNSASHDVAIGPGGAFVTGFFSGTVDLGFGPVTSAGFGDVFILKTGR